MRTSACCCARAVALLGLVAGLGLAMLDPAQSRADAMRRSRELGVAALPPHAKSAIERRDNPMIERERAPTRGKPAEPQRA